MTFREPYRAFTHCPDCGRGEQKNEDPKRFACHVCGFVLHFNVATAVAVFLLRPDGLALFQRRAREPSLGKLGLPGGFVDGNESLEESVRREALEEIGLELDALTFLCSAPNTYPYKGILYRTVDAYFVGTLPPGEIVIEQDEIAEIVWRDPHTVDPEEVAFDSLRAALQIFRQRSVV